MSQHYAFMDPTVIISPTDDKGSAEHKLIFGLGHRDDGTRNSETDIEVAIEALEDASLQKCGGFTMHRGKGGWIDPTGKTIKEEVLILMVCGHYPRIREIAALGKRLLGPKAVYVKRPNGSTALL